MNVLKKTIRLLGQFLALVAALLCVLALVNHLLGNRRFMGFSAAVAVSGSMSGTFEVDDLVVTRQQAQYIPGDIITYTSADGALITHRIVGMDGKSFITQGDANNTADLYPVAQSAVVGKVIFIVPHAGVVVGILRTPAGIALLVVLAGLLVYSLLRSPKNTPPKKEQPHDAP